MRRKSGGDASAKGGEDDQECRSGESSGSVAKMCRTWRPWKNEELKRLEEALLRLKRVRLGKSVKIVQGKDRSGMRRLPPESSNGLDTRNKRRNCGGSREGGAEWQMAATSLYDDVFS